MAGLYTEKISNEAGTTTYLSSGALDNVTLGRSVVGRGWVLLQTETASDDATVTIGSSSLFSSTYLSYKIIGTDILVATDDADMDMKMLIGGSVDANSNYFINKVRGISSAGSFGFDQTESQTTWDKILGNGIGNASGEKLHFEMTVYNPASASTWTSLQGVSRSATSDNHSSNNVFNAEHRNTAACTGLQFIASTGNITSGVFKLYGIR